MVIYSYLEVRLLYPSVLHNEMEPLRRNPPVLVLDIVRCLAFPNIY